MSDSEGDYDDFNDDFEEEDFQQYDENGDPIQDEDEEEGPPEDDDPVNDEDYLDYDNVDVPPEEKPEDQIPTFPFLTQYEITRLLEARTSLITSGDQLKVPLIQGEEPYMTALRELRNGVIPLAVERPDPHNRKTLLRIDPNKINPVTGQRWFNENDFMLNMYTP